MVLTPFPHCEPGSTSGLSQATIRARAFELWERRIVSPLGAELDWRDAVRELCGERRWRRWLLALSCLGWTGVFFFVTSAATKQQNSETQYAQQSEVVFVPLPEQLKAHPKDQKEQQSASLPRLTRDKAIEIGAKETSSRLQLLVLAAGSVFWLAVQGLERAKCAASSPGWRGILTNTALWNSCLSAGFSAVTGFLAMSYFTDLPTASAFSFSGEIEVYACSQVILFVIAIAFFLLAIRLRSFEIANVAEHTNT